MNEKETKLVCANCELCKNQPPLVDEIKQCDVMWVGLSAKKVDCVNTCRPLQNDTNSGKLIEKIENLIPNLTFYRTNLVKCLPLNDNGKLRYPTNKEKEKCFNNLIFEIKKVNPKIVILLGSDVSDFVLKYKENLEELKNIKFLPVKHPSYISVYKRKDEPKYINEIVSEIQNV